MQTAALIPAQTFCIHHNIEISLINSLQQYGLIEVITVEEAPFIPEESVMGLEQYLRLYHELDINLEGIDAITHLLQRIKKMQEEILLLQNRLIRYEGAG